MKRSKSQRYVLKIHSSRLRHNGWAINLTTEQMRENRELIAISESQLIRFIDELNWVQDCEEKIESLRADLKAAKQLPMTRSNRNRIRKFYEELDELLYKEDYVCVIMDSKSDYERCYERGFRLNGYRYKRLLGTAGGVKTKTIVFVKEKRWEALDKRINCGRDMEKEFIPAKLEAYKALVCSSSIPVSMPKGVVVVHDCYTCFKADVIRLDDSDVDEPTMETLKDYDCELDDSDGYGIAMPSLMQRWAVDVGMEEGEMIHGCVIRNAWCKGAVFPVDFQKFAKKNGKDTIVDVWGDEHPVKEVELVLTESMLKLWDSYASMDDYLEKCAENHYTFGITKVAESELEDFRNMNYQFLQSYNFTDEQIDELIAPTVDEIKEIVSGDYRKLILYLKGTELDAENPPLLASDFATALMVEPELRNDQFIAKQIREMIRKRIDTAKVGVLKVPGNYSLVSGDPYSLCQSMFGLEVTGLLKANEVYSKYWADKGVKEIVCFRAPMTCANNIRKMDVVDNDEVREFYKYITTPIVFNSWDNSADAMNGMDKDGDCIITTDFPVIVENTQRLPAIICVQRKGQKCVPTEDDLYESNIRGFGNKVGQVTNKVTSMFEVQAHYQPDSEQYKVLDYRIKCGQLYQQNEIDRVKGIDCKSMPSTWHNWMACADEPDEKKAFDREILSDKKPYFFRYIYASENRKYKDYLKINDEKCAIKFGITLDELVAKENPTDEEIEFLHYYKERTPLGMAPCTINRICWKVENEFDGCKQDPPDGEFDYTILKSETYYSKPEYTAVLKIYKDYQARMTQLAQYATDERLKPDERKVQKLEIKLNFEQKCLQACSSVDALTDILVDACYGNKFVSKQFVWDLCGDVIIRNLLKCRNGRYSYPVKDENGDFEYNGQRYSMLEAFYEGEYEGT